MGGGFDALWSARRWGIWPFKLPTYRGIWPKFFKKVKRPVLCSGPYGRFWNSLVYFTKTKYHNTEYHRTGAFDSRFKYVIRSTDGILQTGANAAERVEMVAISDFFTVEDKSMNYVSRKLMIRYAKRVLNPTRPFGNDAMKYRVQLNGGLCRGMR